VVVMIMIVHSQHSFHAANSTANCGTDYSTYRPSDAISFIKAVRRAARNALSLGRKRKRKYGDASGTNKQFQIHLGHSV
jgi:hypothetical protein